jgi:hypothetical protein
MLNIEPLTDQQMRALIGDQQIYIAQLQVALEKANLRIVELERRIIVTEKKTADIAGLPKKDAD